MSVLKKRAAFELLGVAPGSDDVDVRRAWRDLVRSYHPDLHKTDPVTAHRKLVEINNAFEVLSEVEEETDTPAPQRRAQTPRRMSHKIQRAHPNQPPKRVFIVDTTAPKHENSLTILYPKRRKWTDEERAAARAAQAAFENARVALDPNARTDQTAITL